MKKLQIVYSEFAIQDLNEIYDWYESKQLGQKFLDSVESAESAISKSPFGYESRYKQTCEKGVARFPYLIIYSVEEKVIYVHSIFQTKKNPKKKYRKVKGL